MWVLLAAANGNASGGREEGLICTTNSETPWQSAQQRQRSRHQTHVPLDQNELVNSRRDSKPRQSLYRIPEQKLRVVRRPPPALATALQLGMLQEPAENLKGFPILTLQFAIADRQLPLMHPNSSDGLAAHEH